MCDTLSAVSLPILANRTGAEEELELSPPFPASHALHKLRR